MRNRQLELVALEGIPEIRPGDDVGQIICERLVSAEIMPQANDIIIIAQKIISKAEDRFFYLDQVTPSAAALELAQEVDKDPRLVELILSETDEIARKRRGVLIVRHRLGFVSANAGIDRSNVPQEDGREKVLLLPLDPDASAAAVHKRIQGQFKLSLGVIISDTHGRPHRLGNCGVAIGVAGMPALLDKRGQADRNGHILQFTDIAIADEIAASADLLMGAAAESTPVIVLRGLQLSAESGSAKDLYRSKELDLFR